MTDDLRNRQDAFPSLKIESAESHRPASTPVKKINDGDDLAFFLRSTAYADIMTFILQLNRSMVPQKSENDDQKSFETWPLKSSKTIISPNVARLTRLVQSLESLMETAPPETGPRRFGNAAFRKWYTAAQEATPALMREALSEGVWGRAPGDAELNAINEEVATYLLGSFGSPERLDYGTGHELSFLAFLGCIWKLGGFSQTDAGVEERAIVTGIIQPYLELVRKLILTYTLEPAGSHGVWGLDDHSFIPYILGSAQFCPPIDNASRVPTEGSLSGAPSPTRTAKKDSAEMYRETNMYFSATAFIFDVKTGPFWEHSPTLYDISGIKDGWAKINKGMIKMYNAEVLSKFPVVQHFPFGSLFRWELDPSAPVPATSAHIGSQPQVSRSADGPSPNLSQPSTRAPWANPNGPSPATNMTAAPWASASANVTGAPWVSASANVTGAPWAATGRPAVTTNTTAAPWTRAPPGVNRPVRTQVPGHAAAPSGIQTAKTANGGDEPTLARGSHR